MHAHVLQIICCATASGNSRAYLIYHVYCTCTSCIFMADCEFGLAAPCTVHGAGGGAQWSVMDCMYTKVTVAPEHGQFQQTSLIE